MYKTWHERLCKAAVHKAAQLCGKNIIGTFNKVIWFV